MGHVELGEGVDNRTKKMGKLGVDRGCKDGYSPTRGRDTCDQSDRCSWKFLSVFLCFEILVLSSSTGSGANVRAVHCSAVRKICSVLLCCLVLFHTPETERGTSDSDPMPSDGRAYRGTRRHDRAEVELRVGLLVGNVCLFLFFRSRGSDSKITASSASTLFRGMWEGIGMHESCRLATCKIVEMACALDLGARGGRNIAQQPVEHRLYGPFCTYVSSCRAEERRIHQVGCRMNT